MPRAGHIQPEITAIHALAQPKQVNLTFTGEQSLEAWAPAAGKKVRLKIIILELSADVSLGYRWTSTGTIYYIRISKGPFGLNLVGANDEGAADQKLYLYASGACTVKGTLYGQEL